MWLINVFLFLCFMFNPELYQRFKDAGAPCTVNISIDGQQSPDPQPTCFYDPSNTNWVLGELKKMSASLICLVFAFVLFCLGGSTRFWVSQAPYYGSFISAGLAFWVLATLLPLMLRWWMLTLSRTYRTRKEAEAKARNVPPPSWVNRGPDGWWTTFWQVDE